MIASLEQAAKEKEVVISSISTFLDQSFHQKWPTFTTTSGGGSIDDVLAQCQEEVEGLRAKLQEHKIEMEVSGGSGSLSMILVR